MTEVEALNYAIFALNTLQHPDASAPRDWEQAMEHADAAITTLTERRAALLGDPFGQGASFLVRYTVGADETVYASTVRVSPRYSTTAVIARILAVQATGDPANESHWHVLDMRQVT